VEAKWLHPDLNEIQDFEPQVEVMPYGFSELP
jgi:hypothetical protein